MDVRSERPELVWKLGQLATTRVIVSPLAQGVLELDVQHVLEEG